MGPQEERQIYLNEVQVHVLSFLYRLRMAQALLASYHTSLGVSRETLYCETLIRDMLEACEHAKNFVTQLEAEVVAEAQAGLGKEQFQRGSD